MKMTWIKSFLTHLLPGGVKALPSALALIGLTTASSLFAADPVATWNNFNQLTSGAYTLTKDAACTVNSDGSITLGGAGLELTFTAGQPVYDNNSIMVVMDVSGVPSDAKLVDVTTAGNSNNLYYDGARLYQRAGTTANYGNFAWTPTRATIAFAYDGSSAATGTTTYVNGEQAMNATNLKWTGSGKHITKMTLPATGMKVHSLRIYGTKIAEAEIPAWVPAASFGVNFMNGTGQEVSSTGGFAKGNYEAPSNWLNVTGSANGNSSITVNGSAYNVAWTAHNGTWKSDCATDTFAGKLLYGYLDDCVNDARVKATVTVTGLPADTSYAVALLLSGDGGNNTDFNGRFSSVLINGRPYSYSGSTLLSGDAALVTQTWGDRSKAAAAAGLVEGTNVMLVGGLSGETLTITSAVDEMNVARLTFAGIQVWITPNAQEKVYVRTLNEDGNWTKTNAWALEGSDKIVNAPVDGQDAILTVAADATITMDTSSTLNVFTTTGSKTVTIAAAGENKLTATKTNIETNTIVQADAATLGVATIAEGKTLTVQDLTTTTSITGAGTLNYALGDTTVEGHTFAADGGNYKVSSGTFTDAVLNYSATQTNYEFAGGTITMAPGQNDGQFSFGKANVTIRGGTIYATHLVTVQGQASRPTTIVQTGGDIILSGTGNGSGTAMSAQTIMFGHWPSASSTYTLSGGSLVAENGGLRFGNDSPATMEISGTGLLKVKGIKGKGSTTSALTLAGGKLSIGANGFDNINNLTVTLSGGEFNAFDFATMRMPFTVTGNTKLSADAGKTFTIASQMTVQSGATVTTDGLIVFTEAISNAGTLAVNSGSVTLPAGSLGAVTVARGATLKVKTGYDATTLTNVTLADDTASVYFILPSGKEVKGVVNGTTITMAAQDVYTYTAVAGEENLWSTTSKWTLNGAPVTTVPKGDVEASVELVLTGATTLTMDVANVNLSALAVSGGELTIAGEQTLTTAAIASTNKVVIAGSVVIEGGAEGAPREIANVIDITGTLTTKGALHLAGENRITATATVTIATGTTALNVVDAGISGKVIIAAGASMETIGAVKIATSGTLSGEGSIAGALTLAEGATVAVSTAGSLKLAEGTKLSLPAHFNVVMEEGATLLPGIPIVIFDRVDTDVLSVGTTATVKVGEEVVEDAVFLAAKTGDLVVQIPALFIAEVPVGETAWDALEWKNADGDLMEGAPSELDNVMLQPIAPGAVVTYDTTPLKVNALDTTSAVAIRFNRDCVTQAMYEMIPTTISLVKTTTRVDQKVAVQLTSLKYGALATMVRTETTVEANLTLPEGAVTGNAVAIAKGEMLSVSFKGNGDYGVSGNTAIGLAGYQTLPQNWSQFSGTSAENQAVTVVMLDGTTKTLSSALTFSCNNQYNTGNDNTHMLLRGYLDDGGNGANISITVPTDWVTYTAIIYCATDTGNTTFAAHEVNGQWYTYINNELMTSETRPAAGWGNSNSRSELVVGTNTMVVTGLSGNFTVKGNRSGNPRGGIAAVQLVQTGKPEYALIPGVTATIATATADTVVSWSDLEWKDDEGNSAPAPTAATPATIVLESDVTLNLAGAVAMQIQVVGYGHKLRIADGSAPTTADFVFSSDTIYRITSLSDTLPAKVLRLPGELRYEFEYDASRDAYVTIPETNSNFVAGFKGTFTPAGGSIEFSAGEVNLNSIAGTAVKTEVVFSGTSRTTVAGELNFGEAAVTLRGGAMVTTQELSLSDGAHGYATFLTLEGSSQLHVTGATNEDSNKAAIMFGHWNGSSTVTLRDNATLVAERTDVLIGLTGNTQTLTLEGGEMRVRGVKLSKGASGVNTVTLAGGKLFVGRGGFGHYGTTTMDLIFDGGSLGALSGTVTMGADTAAAIATLTGKPIFESVKGASLELTQLEPFWSSEETVPGEDGEPIEVVNVAINRGGDLRLNGLTLDEIDIQGGSLTAVGALTAEKVTIAANATLSFDGGILTTSACAFKNGATLSLPVRNRQSDSGYLQMTEGAALPDFAGAVVELVLDADRTDAAKVLPEQPIALGLCTLGVKPNVRGVSLRNNTNNAISDYELLLKAGNMGDGLYVALTGNEVLRTYDVKLTDATQGHLLNQGVANGRPYHYFTALVENAKVVAPAEGVAISHVTFTGKKTRLVAASSELALMLQTNNTTFTTDVTIDLSNWAGAMGAFVRGAVRDVPVSQCLISGGITMKQGVSVTMDLGAYTLPEGFTASLEVGETGLYLVVRAERMVRTISVNFTNVATPLSAPPTKPGVYPVAVAAWNDLDKVYSSSELKVADFGGVGSSVAASHLLVFSSDVATSTAAPTSMTKVWLSDMNSQEVRIQGKPFDAYRVVLIFANDLEGAAYAPIQIGESLYAMDRMGYTRRDVEAYVDYHAATGLVNLAVAGDDAWGTTDYPEAAQPVVLGKNALVTDVLTADALKMILPASVYGKTYAGLAALQIIEAAIPEVTITKDFSYTLSTAGDYNLADLTEKWVSGVNNNLTIVANADVTVTLPLNFVAKTITLSGSGSVTLKVENDGGAALTKLDASGLRKNLTILFPCVDVEFLAAKGVTTFEKPFNNNGEVYTIAEGATLVLGETCGITTNMEPNLFADVVADLVISSESQGTLRRNYPVTQNRPGQSGYAWDITLAYRKATIANGNYWQPDMLVEEGDEIVVNSNNFWVTGNTTRRTMNYRQTGGTFVMGNTTSGNNGFLFGPAGDAAHVDGNIEVSGGLLHTSAIIGWDSGAQVTVNVTREGRLSLWNKLHAQNNAAVRATFKDGGTLELANGALNKDGAGTVEVTFVDGVITTAQSEASLNLPVIFNGTAAKPTVLAPMEGSTLVLNAANTGTGVIQITQGKVAIANVAALAGTTTTVKAGATFEVRNGTATATMANSVTFEAGSVLSATAEVTEGTATTVRIAGSLTLPANQKAIQYILNGERYNEVTVDAAAGTVTFTTKATATAVTWDAAKSAGIWGEGVSGPWVDGATYYNGAEVTFVDATAGKVDVTIQGNVAPAALKWQTGSASTYRFNGASTQSALTLTGETLAMGSGQVYNIPVSTVENAALTGFDNTYRLIGALSNGRKSASLVKMPWSANNSINHTTANHGIWCIDGVTLMPQAGEIQTLSAMGYNGVTNQVSHLSGAGNVVITGGGTVQFGGRVIETSANDVAYQNKAYSGDIIIQGGATLDITMERDYNGSRPRDDYPFFALPTEGNQDSAGEPLWTGDEAGISVRDGATFRVSGCRSIFGGWANRQNTSLLNSFPLEIGYQSLAEFAFATRQQCFPHGFRLNGDGAKLLATQNMYVSGGTKIVVAGIGDAGDFADPKTDTRLTAEGVPLDEDTYGKLTAGITTEIASGATTGLVPWTQCVTANDPLELNVGEDSTLNISANLTVMNSGDSLSRFSFKKVGAGTLRFMQTLVSSNVLLDVTEGVLGGTATFTGTSTAVTVAPGTTIEAGLSMPSLTVAEGVTFALDPTGKRVLHADNFTFKANMTYAVKSLLPEAECPIAMANVVTKVLSWKSAQAVTTVSFALDDVLLNKGYGVEVRADGLYLMKGSVYVRELSEATEGGTHRIQWYAENKWYRLDDANKTLRNYDPQEDEAVTVLFLLPSDKFAAADATLPKQVTFILNKAASFAAVRFAVEVTDAQGVTTLKTVSVPLIYEYDLTNEIAPSGGEAKRYSWVSTLTVVREGDTVGLASLHVRPPAGCDYTISDTTAVIYSSAATPALNLNFASAEVGNAAQISTTANPCGMKPFAGVYWNNLSEGSDTLLGREGNHAAWRAQALPAGVAPGEDGQVTTCEVTYIVAQMATQKERLSGSSNEVLTASYLSGQNAATLSDTLRSAANMTNAGTQSGWQVRVASVPFNAYDLYLLLAGNTDDGVNYPAIRVKVGDKAWRTFSMVNGWAAPAASDATWAGQGGLIEGKFIDGQNVLHLRVKSLEGAALEIASWDNAKTTAVGLAAIQIVSCDDGATLERVAAGSWSDAAGWRRELAAGTEQGKWIDATPEAPRYATIPMVQTLLADMMATTPYVTVSGGGMMRLDGTEAALSTGSLNLTEMATGAELAIATDVFADPINVILAPDTIIDIPTTASGTVVNRWKWLTDDAGSSVNATTATIRKKLAGDVVLTNPVPCKLDINDGTLWMDLGQNATMSGAISGESGTFGKKGSGTLTYSGDITLSSENPVRVSEGRLSLTKALTGISGASTVLVDGGTLEMPSGGGFTSGALVVVNRGALIVKNTQRNNRPHLRMMNGATLSRPESGGWQGYQFESITAEGASNVINLNSSGSGGPCIDVLNGFKLLAGASVTVQGNAGGLRVCNGIVDVQEGATLTTKWRIGRGNTDGYGSETDVLTKAGAGLWRIEKVLSPKGDSNWGQTLDVSDGEVCFAFDGATYDVERATPITVKDGAKLSGNVVFTEKSPVTFESGAIIRSGVDGVANSALTLHTVTFNKDMVIEADLVNFKPLTITNAATFSTEGAGDGSEVSIRLTNIGSGLKEAKQLVSWPSGTNHDIAKFSSPEAVALSAKVEADPDGFSSGLWIKPTNEAYVWANESGDWSASDVWTTAGEVAEYPQVGDTASSSEEKTAQARVIASTQDVNLAVDTQGVEAYDWKALSLVTLTEAGKTLTLSQKPVVENEQVKGLNAILVWYNLWKLGLGDLTVEVPVKFRTNGSGSTLNVAAGKMTLTHPLLVAKPTDKKDATEVPTAIDVAEGATLEYALAVTEAEQTFIANTYKPLEQTLTGALTGKGTLLLNGENNVLTINSKTDSDLNVEVLKGQLTMKSELPFAGFRPVARTIKVGVGAQLDISTEHAMGASTNVTWSLTAADTGATVSTINARIRGAINVAGAGTATFGTSAAFLDSALRVDVAKDATLSFGGTWELASNASSTASLTKTGVGTLEVNAFWADVPVTITSGVLQLAPGAVSISNSSDLVPVWSVNKGAALRLGGGDFNLGGNDNDAGRLTILSGGILDCGKNETIVKSPTTLADRATFVYGDANAQVSFSNTTQVNGVVIIDMDALDPAKLTKTSLTLIKFTGQRSGIGSFQLGGNNLVKWAENGWTLRDNGKDVVLQKFGTEGYYIWAGDGSEGSVGEGNWKNSFWVKDQDESQLVAWPTSSYDKPSMKLQDQNPITKDFVPAEAATLDWTMAKQTLASVYVNNTEVNYTLMSSNGSADFSIEGDFLKSGSGKLTVKRATVLGSDGALRLLGGETEFTGALMASSGDFNKPVTVAGEGTILRFSGNTLYFLKGLLEGNGEGTIIQSGAGTLQINDPIEKMKALVVEQGAVTLLANEQYVLSPEITVNAGATLTLAGTYSGAETVKMKVNAGADAQGLLIWNATTATSSDKAPRIGGVDGVAGAAIAVDTFRYQPAKGHLVIDPNDAALKPGFNLVMAAPNNLATSALWLGAQAEPGATLRVATLSGDGVIGVEPTIDLLSDAAWSKSRLLTVATSEADIATAEPFNGSFMGANTPASGDIRVGLVVKNARNDNARTYFRYSGISTDTLIGALTIEENAAAEITGTWAGNVNVAEGGLLMGNGTVGAVTRTVVVPKGAEIAATVYGKRVKEDNTFTTEVVPAELTVKGTLALETGSVVNTIICKNQYGDTWSSLITAETLELPAILEDGAEEVMITVNVTLEEGTVASGVKILGWDNLNGGQRINGNVYINGAPAEDYQLRKKADGLYLYRKSARFLLILQ